MKLSLLALAAVTLVTPLVASASVEIAPGDPAILYVGRFDHTEPTAPRSSWPASTISLTIDGGSASAIFSDEGKSHWQVVINGEATEVLALQSGKHSYSIAQNLPQGTHRIDLVKRTEASQGTTTFHGFTVDEQTTRLPTTPRARHIEVIGDSITCGFGNEAASKEEKFTPATENAWLTYGAIAARALDADYTAIAASGKKLWPDNTIVSLYDRTLTNAANPKWDFSASTPDIIVINLGTNDFANSNPEQEPWVAAYVKFINQLRTLYPKAHIYCAVGPMISEWPGNRKPRSAILGYLEDVVAQSNTGAHSPVRLLDFGVQYQHHGIGAQWHPSVRTHQIMADKMVEAIRRDHEW